MKIRKSQSKQKHAPIWHQMYGMSKIGWHEIIYRQARDLREDPYILSETEICPSMASDVGRVKRKSDMKSSIVEHVTSVKIRISHPKWKYGPVWHRMCDRSKEQVS